MPMVVVNLLIDEKYSLQRERLSILKFEMTDRFADRLSGICFKIPKRMIQIEENVAILQTKSGLILIEKNVNKVAQVSTESVR